MPLYLSEITIRDETAARLMPRDCYGWHKVLWKFFPSERGERDFLYRVDSVPRAIRLYIVSSRPLLVPADLPGVLCRCKEIPESFLSHSDYRFKLRANPTRRVKVDARNGQRKDKGLRAPITEPNALAAWLRNKGDQGGFSIPRLDRWPSEECPLAICPEGRYAFRKPGFSAAHHSAIQFAGALHVEDPSSFRETFRKGIGSAKAFGFGLLLLQPIIIK